MDVIAYRMTMQQFRAAIKRAQAHTELARALRATWPLDNAKNELEDAQFYLALAKAEMQR